MSFYVYMYLDPRHQETWCADEFCFEYRPLYVGKGTGGRVFEHTKNYSSNQCSPILHATLEKLKSQGLFAKVVLVRCALTERAAFALEKRLIRALGRRCDNSGPLANLTLGGEGVAGRVRPQEERDAISAKLKGVAKPASFSAQLSARTKGKPLTDEHRRKLSESHKGNKATPEQRAKLSAARKAEWAQGKRKPVFGTPEHNARLSKLYTGRKLSEETKAKVAASLRLAYAEGRR